MRWELLWGGFFVVLLVVALVVCSRHRQKSRDDTLVVLANPSTEGAYRERRLRVVTIVTETDNANLAKLVRGAAHHGIRVDVLVTDKPFGHAHGWGHRLRVFRRYLDTLPATDVVMFVDGYDVLIDGTAGEILDRFGPLSQNGTKVVFSAESACWPDKQVASKYPPTDSPYKYLNGGTYVATVHTMRRAMDAHFDFASPSFDRCDDQREWTRAFLTGDDIVLDTRCQIFNCLFGRTGDLVRTQRGWRNSVTKTHPLVFHGNGASKAFLFDSVQPGLRCARVL